MSTPMLHDRTGTGSKSRQPSPPRRLGGATRFGLACSALALASLASAPAGTLASRHPPTRTPVRPRRPTPAPPAAGCVVAETRTARFGACPVEVSYDGATAACRAWGGSLASIHSETEQETVVGLIDQGGEFASRVWWIGTRRHPRGFTWDDGTPTDFTHWNDSEPNNAGEVEDCGSIWGRVDDWPGSFRWNDIECNPRPDTGIRGLGWRLGFVCRLPPR